MADRKIRNISNLQHPLSIRVLNEYGSRDITVMLSAKEVFWCPNLVDTKSVIVYEKKGFLELTTETKPSGAKYYESYPEDHWTNVESEVAPEAPSEIALEVVPEVTSVKETAPKVPSETTIDEEPKEEKQTETEGSTLVMPISAWTRPTMAKEPSEDDQSVGVVEPDRVEVDEPEDELSSDIPESDKEPEESEERDDKVSEEPIKEASIKPQPVKKVVKKPVEDEVVEDVVLLSNEPGEGGRWEINQIAWLKANYPSKGEVYCAEQLGRSRTSVKKKVQAMCLKRK